MNSNITIMPSGENLSMAETLTYQSLIENGFVYPITELRLEVKNLTVLREKLKSFDYTLFDYSSNNDNQEILKCDDFTMNISWTSKNVYVTTYCISQEASIKVFSILNALEPKPEDTQLYMDTYYMSNGNLDYSLKVFDKKDYKHTNSLYYPYIDTDVMFEQLFTNKENIVILCGKPGTGKTSLGSQLLKYSVNNPDIMPHETDEDGDRYVQVAYVKSTTVLANDEFWRTLSTKDYDIVILDDLDFFLTARDQEVQTQEDIDRNTFLSQFLSFTDGIEQNKTKFVITTNQLFDDIDSALMRKGRLFDILELRKLTNKEAKVIWKESKLPKKDFPFKDEVLQADLGSMIKKHLNKDVKVQSYLTDDSVSKLSKKNKKLGF